MEKIGLTLGTYAPFHNGHKLVVDTMRYDCDKSYVLIYDDPDRTDIPLYVRSAWLKSMYSWDDTINVIESFDGPTTLGYTPEIIKMHDDYLKNKVGNLGITHFYSSEPYGEHVSRALGAENVVVDLFRQKVPISGTQVRLDTFKYRHLIPRRVYKDLITKAVFYGAPSTGKSTLCEALAKKYNTVRVPEFGRTYWNEHQTDRKLTQEQLYEIVLGQRSWEDYLIPACNQYMFCDTSPITTYMFAIDYFGRASDLIAQAAIEAETDYDLVFVCDDAIPYEDTPDRDGEAHRTTFQKMIISDLRTRQLPYIMLRGSLEERIRKVEWVLDGFNKWEVQIG